MWTKTSPADPDTVFSETLSVTILLQFGLRMVSMIPYDSKLFKDTGIVIKNVWSGAVFNLFIFILTGHVSFPKMLYLFNFVPHKVKFYCLSIMLYFFWLFFFSFPFIAGLLVQ